MGARRRLDDVMVRRSLSDDVAEARALVADDRVTVGGAPATNPARLVAEHEPVNVLAPPPRFVSRAGDKLAAALERFGIDPRGRNAIDVGASTGGFTDCLLQGGARRVVALDVGRAQLAERLARHPAVVVVDRCNVRLLDPAHRGDEAAAEARAAARSVIGPPADLVVVAVSFVSLRLLVDALMSLLATDGHLVALVKPQFEATRREADVGQGVIDDPAVWRRVLEEVSAAFERAGAAMMDAMASPVAGSSGNREFLVAVRHETAVAEPPDESRWRAVLDGALGEAVAAKAAAGDVAGRA
ncbi:MAG: TlyA family RNA methyltransferase [Acidimicrobiia bacterium]|nr:TlyA family RNA methyltransferase [Acidimicrobiia bacterium]